MRTVVTAHLAHLCPHVDEIDHGTIELAFDGPAPELHALRGFLNRFHVEKVTHEELTALVAEEYGVPVTTRWTTAGMTVECSA